MTSNYRAKTICRSNKYPYGDSKGIKKDLIYTKERFCSIDIVGTSRYLGHADPATTLRYYVHESLTNMDLDLE